jgi:hypothetical protein
MVASVLQHLRELLQRLDPEATKMDAGALGVVSPKRLLDESP